MTRSQKSLARASNPAPHRTTRVLVALLVAAGIFAGCGAARGLGRVIGEEEGAITAAIRAAAAAGAHSEAVLVSAAERAGSVIDRAITPLLKSESKESQVARSLFTQVVCDAIATSVQTGSWPTPSQLSGTIGSTLRSEIQPNYGAAQTAAAALYVAQSIWTGSAIDEDAVRNVVCEAVGVRIAN